ncbi:MAG: 2-hydroxyacid dehydrogenase [Puniceicoccales bacterium]|jgi:D-lactate dehydrogenase|nr:2-hydroxyacid dehydrogenase [Puniceicoccales bacterium]
MDNGQQHSIHSIRGIAFFGTKDYDRTFFDLKNRDFGYRMSYHPQRLSEKNLELLGEANVVCAFVNDDLGPRTLQGLVDRGVELLAMRCAGFNNIDLEYARGKITLVRVPAYSPHAVAEHALSLLMALNRRIHRAWMRTREHNFSLEGLMGMDLHGKTFGVIGTGKIGHIFCQLLQGFQGKILVSDPYPNPEVEKLVNTHYRSPYEIYREADIISLHCPLTPENRHMIHRESIAQMKTGVILINTSRGGLIDAEALIEGLKRGPIGAAGLDVYENENDYFFQDLSNEPLADDTLARLISFNNVILTSHQAFFTQEALERIASTTLENIRCYEEGKVLVNAIS